MGGNIRFGSRTDFLPGERLDDIKYERNGGCFVSYKKGFLLLVTSFLFTTLVSYLVYHHFVCKTNHQNISEITDDIVSELLKSAKETSTQKSVHVSKLSPDLKPLFYHLKIQPFLNAVGPKNFSFEGQASIDFEISNSPTKTITLNVKNLKISEIDVSVTYVSKSKTAALVADSQIQENISTTIVNTESETENTLLTSTDAFSSTNVTPSDDNETNAPLTEISTELLEKSSVTDTADEPSNTEIEITSTTIQPMEVITESEQTNMEIAEQFYNEKNETYTIILKLPLEKGINYTLNMKYSGKITDGPGGLLKSKYKQGNDTLWMAYTLLKPNFAKNVFPCFDQPNFKAKFEIEIARKTNMTTVSNMFNIETNHDENQREWVWDHYAPTPLMSTHSVAFAVFGFNSIKSSSSFASPVIKIWRKSAANNGTFALKIVPKLIETYNKLFGYSYSLNKVDLIAVPNLPVSSYGSWGVLFFNENEFLIEENFAIEQKENLLNIMSQELAKEWFGNLISAQSWNDSWITEVISNYARYIGMNAVESDWDLMDEYIVSDKQDFLNIDYKDLLPKVIDMPITIGLEKNTELLLSKKGASIIHLLNLTTTKSDFITGIKKFVNKWKYKNFKEQNLWDEFNLTNSDVETQDFINSWTSQNTFPLITVRQYNDSIEIFQDKFMDRLSKNFWIIPLSYISNVESSETTIWLMDKSVMNFENVVQNPNDSWILFNSNGACLCRINYDLNNWNSLISLLKNKPEALSPTNRAQLLDDAFHLARTGLLNYSITLDMTLYLQDKETHIIPWFTALKNLDYLNIILSKTANYGYFEDYLIKLLEPTYNNLMKDDSKDYSKVKLKRNVVERLCKLNYKSCRDWASTQFDSWMTSSDSNNNIDVNLRSIVYCVGVQNRGRIAWEFLWKKYQENKNNFEEIEALLTGMGCSSESWLLMKYLTLSLKEESLQNSVLIWTGLRSEIAINSALEFLQDNWLLVYDKFKNSPFSLKKILHTVLGQLTSKNDLEHVVNLFTKEKLNTKVFAKDIIFIIETLKQRVTFKQLYSTTIISWIRENLI